IAAFSRTAGEGGRRPDEGENVHMLRDRAANTPTPTVHHSERHHAAATGVTPTSGTGSPSVRVRLLRPLRWPGGCAVHRRVAETRGTIASRRANGSTTWPADERSSSRTWQRRGRPCAGSDRDPTASTAEDKADRRGCSPGGHWRA